MLIIGAPISRLYACIPIYGGVIRKGLAIKGKYTAARLYYYVFIFLVAKFFSLVSHISIPLHTNGRL